MQKAKGQNNRKKACTQPKTEIKNLKKENKKTQISNQRNKNLKCKDQIRCCSNHCTWTAKGQPKTETQT
uniref:Uncharacterized protein n=1 Tax=Anguilla anguilla TaxID=7936 RepID=A0A0E9V0P2_ANGAN